jgi:hypothetical protein
MERRVRILECERTEQGIDKFDFILCKRGFIMIGFVITLCIHASSVATLRFKTKHEIVFHSNHVKRYL